ncbi:MAG: hypothetical protein R3C18_25075 [Planctomycetaceae bacterium]
MISISDYLDWCKYAGLYLGNHSHAHRYKAYEEKISAAGVALCVVHDFLKDNRGGIDLASWRSYNIYEMQPDADYRLELTAKSLEAVGATRTAAKVRTVEDISLSSMLTKMLDQSGSVADMMKSMQGIDPASLMQDLQKNIARAMPDAAAAAGLPVPGSEPVPVDAETESHEQIEHLLNEFVKSHQAELQADYEKLGDVRKQPGFNPQQRLQELDVQYTAELQSEQFADDAEKLVEYLVHFEKRFAKQGAKGVDSIRSKILSITRKYGGKSSPNLGTALAQAMQQASELMQRHQNIFSPPAIDDPELIERLEQWGEYRVDIKRGATTVYWPDPVGFDCDFMKFTLRIEFPTANAEELRRHLTAAVELHTNFPTHIQRLRETILESFHNYQPFAADWELEEYERDFEGNILNDSILATMGTGQISILVPEYMGNNELEIMMYAGLDWDQEHGLEFYFVDEE